MLFNTRRVDADDKVEGSNEKARAIWACGWADRPVSAAHIARIIRAKTALNWEGPQASRFFRRNRKAPQFARELQPNGRYHFSLSDLGRQIYEEMFMIRDETTSCEME